MANILVYGLAHEGQVNKNSRGAVSEAAKVASQLGGEAHAVLVGAGVDALAPQLGAVGASKVWTVDAPEGIAQVAADAIAALVDAHGYDYVLFGGGLLGFEIGAAVAAKIGGGLTVEATEIAARRQARRQAPDLRRHPPVDVHLQDEGRHRLRAPTPSR